MRYLALDLGDRRIGVAISDRLGMIARPLLTLQRASRLEDFTRITRLVRENAVDCVIVGLPVNMNGTEGTRAAWARDYSAALAAAAEVPVCLWDERLTTVEAEALLRAQGKSPDKASLDACAAAVILQSYLDAASRPGEAECSSLAKNPQLE